MGKTSEHTVEVEGANYVVLKSVDEVEGVRYSMDGGANWRETIAEAYVVAKDQGKLVILTSETKDQGEYEAFVIELTRELQEIKQGGVVKIVHDGDRYLLLKEEPVLACRASAIQEINLGHKEGQ